MSRQMARVLARVWWPRWARGRAMSRTHLLRVADYADPTDLGVCPELDAKGRKTVSAYVARDADAALRARLRELGPQLVILHGPVGSGRHRMAYEAALDVLSDHLLVRPTSLGQFQEFLGQADRDRDYLVWLDEVDLAGGAAVAEALTGLLADRTRRVVVLAVLDPDAHCALAPAPAPSDPLWPTLRQVADLVAQHSLAVHPENARWLAATAQANAGYAERYKAGRSSAPAAGALLAAAADCYRMGAHSLPESMVQAVYLEYLPGSRRARAVGRVSRGALRFARRKVQGVPMLVRDSDHSYRIRGQVAHVRDAEPIPTAGWQAAIDHASAATAYQLGQVARNLSQVAVAVQAFARAAAGEIQDAAYWHGITTGEAGRADLAVDLLRGVLSGLDLATDEARYVTCRVQIAHFRGESGDVPGAIQELDELLNSSAGTGGSPARPELLGAEYCRARWRCVAGNARTALADLRDIATRHRASCPGDIAGLLAVQYAIAYWTTQTGAEASDPIRRFADLVTTCARRHGDDHPRTLAARSDLACLWGESGDAGLAVQELWSLCASHEPRLGSHGAAAVLGAYGVAAVRTHGNLARWLARAGRLAEAISRYELVVEACLLTIGDDHPLTLLSRGELAGCLARRDGDGPEARTILEDVLRRQHKVCGPKHPETLRTRYQLAQTSDHPGARSKSQLVCIGRQPVYHKDGWIIGYELLFRDSHGAISATKRDAAATSRVIVNAFTDFSVSELAEGRLYFLNVTREFLIGTLPLPVAADWVVLEVLETVDIDDAVVDGVRKLAGQGYQVALDTVGWSSAHDRLLPYVHYVKLDVQRTDRGLAETIAWACREHPHIALIGQRIETPAHRALAVELGCELFQGYALARPYVVSGRVIPSSRLRHIQLVKKLLDPEGAETVEISRVIMTDPGLTSRVLKMCNSAQSGLRERVSSVRQAVVLLGQEQLHRWITLMDLSDLVEGDEWRLASMIDWIGLGQLVARRIGLSEETAFLVGLLTEIAELHQRPVAEVAPDYPLEESIISDIVTRSGKIGQMLNTVAAYKVGDVERLQNCDIPSDDLMHMYLTAVRDSDEMTSLVTASTK